MSYFRTCPRCGAHLDPGEVCDCLDLASTIKEARDLFPEFSGLTDLDLLREIVRTVQKAAQGADITLDGEAEHVDHAVSASNDT